MNILNTNYNSISLTKVIGEVENTTLKKNKFSFPTFTKIINNLFYIFDPIKDNRSMLIFCVNNGIVKRMRPNKSIRFRFMKAYSYGEYLGIDDETNNIIFFSNKGEVIKEYKVPLESYPISFDRSNTGQLWVLDKKKKQIFSFNKDGELNELTIKVKEVTLQYPTSIQSLCNGNLLLTDEGLHTVFEIDQLGHIVWTFGSLGLPGNDNKSLTYPQSAMRLENGNTLISDSMNNRIIEVNYQGNIVWRYGNILQGDWEEVKIKYPKWVDRQESGNTVITDSGNARIIEVDKNSKIIQEIGERKIKKKLFSYPRSVQLLENETILVADTVNNRVLIVDFNNRVLNYYRDLYWPRSAEKQLDGTIIISDSLNKQIVSINEYGEIIKKIDGWIWEEKYNEFVDPHYTKQLENGNLLVVDSERNVVLEINDNREAIWLFGFDKSNRLSDPHCAARNKYYETIIADSGNNRVILVNREKKQIFEISKIVFRGHEESLNFPRYCSFYDDEHPLFVNGVTGSVIITNRAGKVVRYYAPVNKQILDALQHTRGICFINNRIIISDYNNSRVLIGDLNY
ncbi:hypothetical protein ACUIJN_09560 [Metabacillus halosaccharovorans]|uniref:hypothetical protein n=1 Tax=Metabacillus halosaccharovorans TaxID=930124 RepID=UPI00204217D4|nr:hypothetical protein [Metabacillus halosaccharovorans]MCM3444724.1 hypothetical protein [Metabacillus halosaccharovorans]